MNTNNRLASYKNLIKQCITFIFVLLLVIPVLLTAQQPPVTISGLVTTNTGRGIDGVLIAFFDGSVTQYTTTAGGGYYSYLLFSGWAGTVTATHDCYSFNPASVNLGPLTSDTSQDFSGDGHTYEISGIVSDGAPIFSGGILMNPLVGVTLTLSTGQTTSSGSDGSYSFTVSCGWMGTLTPMKVGWQFAPLSVVFREPVMDDELGHNFVASAASSQYTISGAVTEQSGRTGMAGVTVTFFDGLSITEKITDSKGNYSYTVPAFWVGSVSPSLDGYSFDPTTANLGPVQANISQDFTAIFNTYIISGTVMDTQANPIENVTMTLSTGSETQTDASGQYEFVVTHGWSGNLTASKTGWTFKPLYRNFSNLVSDQPNENFFGIAVKAQYTVSGTVTASGTPLAGVVLDGLPDTPQTDAAGFYSSTVVEG